MNNTQKEIDKMNSGNTDAILSNINSENAYLMLNAIIFGTKRKIKDKAFIEGVKKAQDSEAEFLGLPVKDVAEASFCYLTGKEYTGGNSLISSLISSEFDS